MKTPPNRNRKGDAGTKTLGLVKVGGVDLPAEHAQWIVNYIVHFNGSEAARAVGQSDVSCALYASRLLSNTNVRLALRNALIERQQRAHHDADEVSRYWWALATADARELSGIIYVPCRHCWGVDHDYQFTDVEQRERQRDYAQQNADLPEAPLFFEGGGGGYTTNRYPMRGPDWAKKIERYFASIERPVPEGLIANSEHSCPACHGDGIKTLWLADTRHLNPEPAILFNGIKQTKDGIEIKMRDRDAAMREFAQLTGMSGPLRVAITPDMSQLTAEALTRELASRGVVVDAEYDVVSDGVARSDSSAGCRPLGLPRPDLLRPRSG